MWTNRVALLQDLVTNHLDDGSTEGQMQQSIETLNQTFMSHLEDVRKRNEAMLFRDLPPRIRGALSSALADIKVSSVLVSY